MQTTTSFTKEDVAAARRWRGGSRRLDIEILEGEEGRYLSICERPARAWLVTPGSLGGFEIWGVEEGVLLGWAPTVDGALRIAGKIRARR